ncbi:MAG: membrane protein insertase YidC [Terriglobia bacterium]|jgi:YidC/Oxa1 family membrane protein insertase
MNLDQEKRVMIAFALSIVMLILYRVYFVKEPPPEPKKAVPAAATATPHAGQPGAPTPATTAAPPAPVALPVSKGAKPEEIVVEGKLYRVTFSTVGAVVRSWVLKDYPKGEQIDTIDSHACEILGFPLSVTLADATLNSQVNQAIYVAKAYSGEVATSGQEPVEQSGNTFSPPVNLTFTYSDGKIEVKKQFSFSELYSVKSHVSVFDGQHYLPLEVAWPGGFRDQSLPPAVGSAAERAAYETVDESKVREVTLVPSFFGRLFSGGSGGGGNELQQDVSGPLVFVGLEDRFFAGIFLPDSPDIKARINREVWTPPDFQGDEKSKPKPLAVRLGSLSAKPLDFRLFVAPKALDVLKSFKPPLDSIVDFGWFSFIAKPLFIALHYIYDHWVHNYGWAIVLITLIINLAMFPLKIKGLKSAQEMQKVQPIIKGIQDKYKQYKFNDPRKQKMNEEIMKVYSEHHINPLGSCVPMALQLPFLYGFFQVLNLSIELRHAPWFWWLKDLSAPDPYYVLPIIMVVTMFILQRMTPTPTVDPSQQRMMMLMPLMFGFMFFRLASGLNLYYATSNAIGLVQQVYINRKLRSKDPLVAPARKPATAKE